MKNDIYLSAKQLMKTQAQKLKKENNDKPYIRYELNNLCDDMCRQFNWYAMKERISEKQANLYSLWLQSLTSDLHP